MPELTWTETLSPKVGDPEDLLDRWGPLIIVVAYILALLAQFGAVLFGSADVKDAASSPAVAGIMGVLGPMAGAYLMSMKKG